MPTRPARLTSAFKFMCIRKSSNTGLFPAGHIRKILNQFHFKFASTGLHSVNFGLRAELSCSGILIHICLTHCSGIPGRSRLFLLAVFATGFYVPCSGVCRVSRRLFCSGVCRVSRKLFCSGVCRVSGRLFCSGVCRVSRRLFCSGVCRVSREAVLFWCVPC